MKRIISLMLTLAVALSLLVLPAGAASTPEEALGEVNIFDGGYSMKYLAVNGKVQTQSYTYFLYRNSAGETQEIPAYCINPNQYGVPQTVAEGESIRYLAEEKASDPKIVGLVANMYPHRSLAELGLSNKYQAFYAGKIALWCYLIPEWDISDVTVAPGLTGSEREIGENILNAAVKIYTEGTRWTSVADPQLTASPDQETAYPVTIDGSAYRQQVFTVTSPTWVDGLAVNVSFQDGADVPEGTRIVDENNQDITQVKVSNTGSGYKGTFKVLYPEDSVAGQAWRARPAASSSLSPPTCTSTWCSTPCARRLTSMAISRATCATQTPRPACSATPSPTTRMPTNRTNQMTRTSPHPLPARPPLKSPSTRQAPP